jgi:hypothetical protein
MEGGLERVLRERQAILARVASQRAELGAVMANLERPAAYVDKGVAALRYMKERPLLVGVLFAVAFALRGRTLLGFAARGLGAWKLVERLGGVLRGMRS